MNAWFSTHFATFVRNSFSKNHTDLTYLDGLPFWGIDGQDFVIFFLMELDSFGVIKDTEQVRLNGMRITGLPKNLKQGWVWDKEEPGEQQAFLL